VAVSDASDPRILLGLGDYNLVETRTSAAVRSTVEPDDETLLLQVQASNREALKLLFQRYSSLIFSVARSVLRDDQEAEDLVQDVFIFVISKSKLFDALRGPARSWLLQVAYHRAYDRRRYLATRGFYHRAGKHEATDVHSEVAQEIANPEDFFAWQSYLRPAMDTLSENQRKVLMLFFYEGYTLHEISKQLQQSFGNIQHHFYRGIDRLRKYVFKEDAERAASRESAFRNSACSQRH
jgi:RNA polymerase sigma-70 factor (ECF subfamily)